MLTDFHSHILPGIDDGSRSLDQSLSMLREEVRQGVTRVIATPHFYARHNDPERFLEARQKAAEVLLQAVEQKEQFPQILIGAEVHFYSGMSDSEVLSRLTIAGKKCILIEMPHSSWTSQMYRELEWIYTKQGITPILAHIDRYIAPFRTHGIPERLADLPVMVQANASFFRDRFSAPLALRMLRKGQIHFLGSDCHNLTDRAPNLDGAVSHIEKKIGIGALDGIERNVNRLLL